MNSRALAIWSLAAISFAVTTANPVYRALVLLIALNLLVARRRPGVRLVHLFRVVGVASVIATLITLVVSHTGAHAVLTIPEGVPVLGGSLTLEALAFGVSSGLGIAAAVVAAAPLSLIAEPHELVDALPRLLSRSGAAVATALNLLPALGRSAVEIREAQRMRGAGRRRLGALRDVAVPVVLTAVEDSVRLAEAMEARAYGSGERTHFAVPHWRPGDVAVALLAASGALLFIGLRISGIAADWYPFPVITVPPLSVPALAALAGLAPPLLMRR